MAEPPPPEPRESATPCLQTTVAHTPPMHGGGTLHDKGLVVFTPPHHQMDSPSEEDQIQIDKETRENQESVLADAARKDLSNLHGDVIGENCGGCYIQNNSEDPLQDSPTLYGPSASQQLMLDQASTYANGEQLDFSEAQPPPSRPATSSPPNPAQYSHTHQPILPSPCDTQCNSSQAINKSFPHITFTDLAQHTPRVPNVARIMERPLHTANPYKITKLKPMLVSPYAKNSRNRTTDPPRPLPSTPTEPHADLRLEPTTTQSAPPPPHAADCEFPALANSTPRTLLQSATSDHIKAPYIAAESPMALVEQSNELEMEIINGQSLNMNNGEENWKDMQHVGFKDDKEATRGKNASPLATSLHGRLDRMGSSNAKSNSVVEHDKESGVVSDTYFR